MTAKDIFHSTVRNALEKEDWIITTDPLFIRSLGVELYIDLAAEKIIGAEKDGCKIAIEIKSFIGTSVISEFHKAVGQFLNYRLALKNQEPERQLYLAVPEDTYETFFKIDFVRLIIKEYQIEIIVYNPEEELIVKWET
jgi:hypothetical protein